MIRFLQLVIRADSHRILHSVTIACILLQIIHINRVSSFSSLPINAADDPVIKRIAILTSGGDCPGINACIRSIVKTSKMKGIDVWGLPIGFPGLIKDPPEAFQLDESFESTSMLTKGGSRLGGFVSSDYSSGFDKLSLDEKAITISKSLDSLGIDGIIATGGDSSFERIATLLLHCEGNIQIPFVGVPKTIDNDIPETIYSIGYQSAVSTAAHAIANARDTAESHRRIIVVECMGREAGFLTLHAGLAGGADTILLPEFPVDNDELLHHIEKVHNENKCAVVAVSESITLPENGEVSRYTTASGTHRLGGSAEATASFLAKSLNIDARHIVLGHLQRGGSPNTFDQVLATTLGAHAVKSLCQGESEIFVTWNGYNVENVPLDNVREIPSKCLSSTHPELIAAQSLGIYVGTVL